MLSTPERLELVNFFIRAAREAERQNPVTSRTAPVLRHLGELAGAGGVTGDDWDLIAQAAFRRGEQLVARVAEQRARPAVVERGPWARPWAAESA